MDVFMGAECVCAKNISMYIAHILKNICGYVYVYAQVCTYMREV